MTLLRRIRRLLFGTQHVHEWNNTGLQYQTPDGKITIVVTHCASCGIDLIVEV